MIAAVIGFAALLSACIEAPPAPRYPLGVMSAVPLFWPEREADDLLGKEDQRAGVIRLLDKHYDLRPLDLLDAKTLGALKLLILAQPRAWAPAELGAPDEWVRRSGRLRVYADPQLDWPSRYPLGDPRRAPTATLLDPLFAHWGLALSATDASAGAWSSTGPACVTEKNGLYAVCVLGAGKAILVADADMLDLDSGGAQNRENGEIISALVSRLAREIPDSPAQQRESQYEQEKNKLVN